METGIDLIAKERQEQTAKHGYDLHHDIHVNDEYELQKAAIIILDPEHHDKGNWEAIEWNKEMYIKIINKPRVEQLAIAGALIAAEIDRLQNK